MHAYLQVKGEQRFCGYGSGAPERDTRPQTGTRRRASSSGWPLGFASAPYDPVWAMRHPRRAGWTAVAGPASNLIISLLAVGAIRLGVAGGRAGAQGHGSPALSGTADDVAGLRHDQPVRCVGSLRRRVRSDLLDRGQFDLSGRNVRIARLRVTMIE
jgi:hypothetical protein